MIYRLLGNFDIVFSGMDGIRTRGPHAVTGGMYSNQLNYHSVWDCKYTNHNLLYKCFVKKV